MGNIGKVNAYTCEKCAKKTITRDADNGVTPFMIDCVYCGGMAQSAFYRVPQTLMPTHEWYHPDKPELLEMVAYPELLSTIEHVAQGGLLLRKIDGPSWLERWKDRLPAGIDRKLAEVRLMNDTPGPRFVVSGCQHCSKFEITLWETAQYAGACTEIYSTHETVVEAVNIARLWGGILDIPVEIENDLVEQAAEAGVLVRGENGKVCTGGKEEEDTNGGSAAGSTGTDGVHSRSDRGASESRGSSTDQDKDEEANDLPLDPGCHA